MASDKNEQTKLKDDSNKNNESFILDMKKEIKPITSQEDESNFIQKTMKLQEARKKEEKVKKTINTEKLSENKPKEDFIKEIKEVETDLKKEIEVRKIIKPSIPINGITRTADLFGQGFHYFIELEEKFTHDFIFGYLPEKIKKYIKLIIPFALMFLVLNLPLNLDPEIKKAFALFVCISLMWALESINIVVTALFIPVLSVLLGLIKNSNPFSSFSNPIIYLLLSGLVIAQAFRKHELDKMLAVKVLAFSKGNVKRLLFFTMLITAILGMWMSNTATIALLIPVIISISHEINQKTQKNYMPMLLLSSGFASSIGGISTIIGGNPNAITAAFLRNISLFSFLDWSMIGFPISVILFFLAYFVFVRIYRVKEEKVKITSLTKEAKKIKLNNSQRKILMIFIPTIFFWLFGGEISHLFNIPSDFYNTEIIGLAASILLFAFRVLEWDDVRRIPWEIFLLVGGGLTLGQILIETGSASYLASNLFSAVSFLPEVLIILLFVMLTIVLANFVNNSSAAIIMVPVVLEIAPFLDINASLFAMAVAMATAIAPLTPIAMPSFSLIYGTGLVRRSEMIKTGFKVAIICGPVLAILVYGMNVLFF